MQAALWVWTVAMPVLLAQDVPRFRTDITFVRVEAEVTDVGRTLSGFGKQDFTVTDNGAPQTILYFSQDEEPLDLILLFDVSGSMGPSVRKIADSAREALAELRRGDRVAVMTFDFRARLIAPFTSDFEVVERTIREDVLNSRFRGGTRILAAVEDAASEFRAQPKANRRRAVLVFTDNHGVKSRREANVVRRLWEADAVLSGLLIRNAAMTALYATPMALPLKEGMSGAAEKTGGDVVKAGDPGPAFRDMLERIRRRYCLYYAMPRTKPGEVRQVRVELAGEARKKYPSARVRARKGYVAPRSPVSIS